MDPKNFFLHESGSALCDVLGDQEALSRMILELCGGQAPAPGFFETNREEIYKYFRSGHFPVDFARIIKAPMEEVEPKQRPVQQATQNQELQVETVESDCDK